MTDDLDTKTDAQLSGIFAVEVAEWEYFTKPLNGRFFWRNPHNDTLYGHVDIDFTFATSADAVMQWLNKYKWEAWKTNDTLSIGIKLHAPEDAANREILGAANADTFPKAACIALIRANRTRKGARA